MFAPHGCVNMGLPCGHIREREGQPWEPLVCDSNFSLSLFFSVLLPIAALCISPSVPDRSGLLSTSSLVCQRSILRCGCFFLHTCRILLKFLVCWLSLSYALWCWVSIYFPLYCCFISGYGRRKTADMHTSWDLLIQHLLACLEIDSFPSMSLNKYTVQKDLPRALSMCQ